LTFSAAMAAIGQVLLKLGADGQLGLMGLINPRVIGGLALYGFNVIIWLVALARLPLHVVYPFTVLTLVLVFAASVILLGERPSPLVIGGWTVVVVGIGIVAYAST
jgi:drug/metabolite transporter (DMT)-like permease